MTNPQINLKFLIIFILFVSLWICGFVDLRNVNAVNMNSNQYRIQFGTIDIGGAKMDDSNNSGAYNLTTSLGQTAAAQFESSGYIVKAGFQYIYSRIPFTFSVSNIKADLGTLMPSTPSTTTINLAVSFGGAGQYIVTASEKGALKNFNGVPIPNTVCDAGDCLISLAKPWVLSSTYGFGYNMSGGTDIPADFLGATYYRPFADFTLPQIPQPVMQSINVTQNLTPTPNPTLTSAPMLTGTPRNTTHQATMTFKVNISPLQPAGSYNTVIYFVATPSF